VDINPETMTKNRILLDIMDLNKSTIKAMIDSNQGSELRSKKDNTLEKAQKYNYQHVIYHLHMDPKKPIEEIKELNQGTPQETQTNAASSRSSTSPSSPPSKGSRSVKRQPSRIEQAHGNPRPRTA
jgi:hypothetical protein